MLCAAHASGVPVSTHISRTRRGAKDGSKDGESRGLIFRQQDSNYAGTVPLLEETSMSGYVTVISTQ